MRRLKDSLVLGFAIFAAFFGAGNLILPPSLGVSSGDQGFLVSLGFMTSAAFIPLLALFGQGVSLVLVSSELSTPCNVMVISSLLILAK